MSFEGESQGDIGNGSSTQPMPTIQTNVGVAVLIVGVILIITFLCGVVIFLLLLRHRHSVYSKNNINVSVSKKEDSTDETPEESRQSSEDKSAGDNQLLTDQDQEEHMTLTDEESPVKDECESLTQNGPQIEGNSISGSEDKSPTEDKSGDESMEDDSVVQSSSAEYRSTYEDELQDIYETTSSEFKSIEKPETESISEFTDYDSLYVLSDKMKEAQRESREMTSDGYPEDEEFGSEEEQDSEDERLCRVVQRSAHNNDDDSGNNCEEYECTIDDEEYHGDESCSEEETERKHGVICKTRSKARSEDDKYSQDEEVSRDSELSEDETASRDSELSEDETASRDKELSEDDTVGGDDEFSEDSDVTVIIHRVRNLSLGKMSEENDKKSGDDEEEYCESSANESFNESQRCNKDRSSNGDITSGKKSDTDIPSSEGKIHGKSEVSSEYSVYSSKSEMFSDSKNQSETEMLSDSNHRSCESLSEENKYRDEVKQRKYKSHEKSKDELFNEENKDRVSRGEKICSKAKTVSTESDYSENEVHFEEKMSKGGRHRGKDGRNRYYRTLRKMGMYKEEIHGEKEGHTEYETLDKEGGKHSNEDYDESELLREKYKHRKDEELSEEEKAHELAEDVIGKGNEDDTHTRHEQRYKEEECEKGSVNRVGDIQDDEYVKSEKEYRETKLSQDKHRKNEELSEEEEESTGQKRNQRSRCRMDKRCIKEEDIQTEDEVDNEEERQEERRRRRKIWSRMKRRNEVDIESEDTEEDNKLSDENYSIIREEHKGMKPSKLKGEDFIARKILRLKKKRRNERFLQELIKEIVSMKIYRPAMKRTLMREKTLVKEKEPARVKTSTKTVKERELSKQRAPVKEKESDTENKLVKRKEPGKESKPLKLKESMTENELDKEKKLLKLKASIKRKESGKEKKSTKESDSGNPSALLAEAQEKEIKASVAEEGQEKDRKKTKKEYVPGKLSVNEKDPTKYKRYDSSKDTKENGSMKMTAEKEHIQVKEKSPVIKTVPKKVVEMLPVKENKFVKENPPVIETENKLVKEKPTVAPEKENKLVKEKPHAPVNPEKGIKEKKFKNWRPSVSGRNPDKDKELKRKVPVREMKQINAKIVPREKVVEEDSPSKGLEDTSEYALTKKSSLQITFKDSSLQFGDVRIIDGASLISNFKEYLEDNHSLFDTGFRIQFMNLDHEDRYSTSIGTSIRNMRLNRYKQITVYNHNRIVLRSIPDVIQSKATFINASYIDGFLKPHYFIATQGPLHETLADFWRMVWQEKVPTIVMLTDLKEGTREKCVQYWPESESTNFGPFEVTLTHIENLADYCMRTILVNVNTRNRSIEPLKVKQYQFKSWLRSNLLDHATLIQFYRTVLGQHDASQGPILVHCSAGVGSTGTFICIHNVLEEIKYKQVVDITGTIRKMRCQRMKMVQSLEQYIYIHDIILDHLICGETQIACTDIKQKLQELTEPRDQGSTMLEEQFEVLNDISTKIHMVCSVALKHINRNRTMSFVPSDMHRVSIKDEDSNYIHASYVKGYRSMKAYIIAEGPMASTVREMWKVIFDSQIAAVVMLSDLVENRMESSYQYWPTLGEPKEFGEYKVELVKETRKDGLTMRTLNAYERKKTHSVTQFHITCWGPDGKCSNFKSVVDVINEIVKIQRNTGNKPIWVHCSDTVTRSSIFCALATVIDRCKMEGVLDVFQTVRMIRNQKPKAVPEIDHYQMIFEGALVHLEDQ